MSRVVSRARVASSFAVTLVAAAIGAAPSAHALDTYTQDPLPNLEAAGGCDGLCHATGFTSSPLYIDFEAAGGVWNATMASFDSDGDGFSNGWELQDPAGTWVTGTPNPGSAVLVSNPAVSGSLPPLPVATTPIAIVHAEAAGDDLSEEFAIQNVGAVPFDYAITALAPSDVWMTPDPASAQALPANDQDAILLLFATSGLGEGLYEGDLRITIPGIRADRIPLLPVDLTVPEPGAIAAHASAIAGLAALARRRTNRGRAHLA